MHEYHRSLSLEEIKSPNIFGLFTRKDYRASSGVDNLRCSVRLDHAPMLDMAVLFGPPDASRAQSARHVVQPVRFR